MRHAAAPRAYVITRHAAADFTFDYFIAADAAATLMPPPHTTYYTPRYLREPVMPC